MKFSINTNQINQAVATVAAYTDAKDVNASCVFLSGSNNTISIEATNFNEAIRVKNVPVTFDTLDASFEKIAIEGKKLSSIVKAFDDGEVVFEINENELVIKQGRTRYKVTIMADNSLSEIKFPTSKTKLALNSELINGFEKIAHAIDPNNGNHSMAGSLLSIKKGAIALVGTDSKRLAGMKFEYASDEARDAIIPKAGMNSIVKLFKGQTISASMDETRLTIQTNSVEYTTKLVNGKYPQWERIVPKSVKMQIELSATTIQGLIKKALVIGTDGVITIENGELAITVTDERNESITAATEFSDDVQGVRFGVNLRFIQDFLSAQIEDSFQLMYNDANSPFMLKSGSMMEVIMPIIDIASAQASNDDTDASESKAA